jgi:cyclohexanecarboxylate-CoA ligase
MPDFATRLTEAMVRDFTSRGLWGERTINDYVDEAAARAPNRLAIIDSRGQCTYGELRAQSLRCAAALLKLGIGPGDVVSLQLPNWREWTILHLAVSRIGAITNPLVPAYRERELTYMLELSESSMLVVPDRFRGFDHAGMAMRLKEQLPNIAHVLVLGDDVPEGALSWRDLAESDAVLPADLPRVDANAVTEIIFTSGTTGVAKGVLHTSNTIIAPQIELGRVLNLDEHTVLHIVSTFGHQTGFLGGVRLPLQLGATCVYQDIWDVETFLRSIAQHRITISNGGPTFLQDMLRSPHLAEHDLSSFRIFRCGGAPIPRVLLREAREKLPHVSVHSGWGQSEDAVVTITRPGDPEDRVVETDGRVQDGMEIRVADAKNNPMPPGQEGRLLCRGAFLFVGYAKRPDLNAQCFYDDWFDTDDLAVMDEQGFIRITGRTKDIIIRGGENIPVAYVENVLYEDPRIQDVAIVAMPDPRLGERACAFVLPRAGQSVTLDDIKAHLDRSLVAKQYWPERLELVSELPRAANGKIRKAELRERIAAMMADAKGAA